MNEALVAAQRPVQRRSTPLTGGPSIRAREADASAAAAGVLHGAERAADCASSCATTCCFAGSWDWRSTMRSGITRCSPRTATGCLSTRWWRRSSRRSCSSPDHQPPVPVESGEIVVLPRNDDHVIGSALNLRAVSAEHLIQPAAGGGLAKIVHGGGGERTKILCGFLGNDMPHNAIIALLPSVLKLKVTEGASGSWIESSFRFAAKELSEGTRPPRRRSSQSSRNSCSWRRSAATWPLSRPRHQRLDGGNA